MNRLALASLLFLGAAGCGRIRSEAPPASDAVPVKVAPVVVEAVARPLTATGTLGPKEEVPLSFKIGGVVGRVLVDEGQIVRTGDTLAALDLSEIDAAVARARSGADKAARDLARAQRLYADTVATLEQVQDAQTGRDVAAAELESAAFNRRYAVIVAPSAGVILKRSAEPGELAQAGTAVLTLGSRARGVVFRAALADRDAVQVALGDRAEVRFDALPDRAFAGTVTEIAAAADPQTGTYRVEVALPAAAGLASGLVGRVDIRPRAARRATMVPVEAVLEADGSRASVFALSPDGRHALRRSVTVGFLAGDRVAVVSGLEGVTAVITDGGAYLDDGTAVRVRP
ncbi:MAG TPA: efflux RND transporter periplasmic adaptor subunit [Gemmatimonadales bacterium]|nr:efflux RND transporter periplasmic adaptor subunit [Gemmatimonadales bacterium]